jgi:hypothetical protein
VLAHVMGGDVMRSRTMVSTPSTMTTINVACKR